MFYCHLYKTNNNEKYYSYSYKIKYYNRSMFSHFIFYSLKLGYSMPVYFKEEFLKEKGEMLSLYSKVELMLQARGR